MVQPAATGCRPTMKSRERTPRGNAKHRGPLARYEHMKPDANLVIGNYEPCIGESTQNWQLHSVTACPFRSKGSRGSKLGREAEKADEPNAGLVAGTRAESMGGKWTHTATGGIVRPELGIVRLELKYCERCGGLWTRQHGVVAKPLRTVHGGRNAAHETVEGKEQSVQPERQSGGFRQRADYDPGRFVGMKPLRMV